MQIRRIVTGHDTTGKAVFLQDSLIKGGSLPDGEAAFAVIWRTIGHPVDNNDATDRAAEPVGLTQANGSILRIVDIPPGKRSPMHRTNSLDYGIVLQGAVGLELDDGASTLVQTGEVVVQRGTIHAWFNPGQVTARVAFILLDAHPASPAGLPLPPVGDHIAPTGG